MSTINTSGIDPTKPAQGDAKTVNVRDNFTAIKNQLGNAKTDITNLENSNSIALDIGDDGNNESSSLIEIATSGDTNSIATESVTDKLLFNMSKRWPGADIAGALDAGALDNISEISSILLTGVDTNLVTGTKGTSGNFIQWNVDGDAVDSGNSASDFATALHTHTLSDITDSGAAASKNTTGADTNVVSGTSGTTGNLIEWNGDGDAVDSGKSSNAVGSVTTEDNGTVVVANSTAINFGSNLTVTDDTDGTITVASVSGGTVTLWIKKSANYTASSGDKVLADTSGSAWTLTLPAALSTGDFVKAADSTGNWATNNLTVDGNGNNIEGAATFTGDVNGGAFECVYNGTEWKVRFSTGQ